MRRFLAGFLTGAIVVAGVAWLLWPEAARAPTDRQAAVAPPAPTPPPAPPVFPKSPTPKTPEELATAKREAKRVLEEVDADDPEAHALLGHREFAQPLPEAISYTGYPFLRVVEEANAKRWFDDAKEWNRAMQARERMLRHAHRLETDRVYRCLDGARANVARDEFLKDYVFATYAASPYLLCYTDGERLSETELDRLSPADRRTRLDEADAKRASWRKILAEKGRLFTQLYAEFLRRYGEACDLKDLMAPYGGRPDYGVGKRSYADGCPLVVWIFSDKQAWLDHHTKVLREELSEDVAGYYNPQTGWVHSYDEPATERDFEVEKLLRVGALQLLSWFRAQANEWQTGVRSRETWFRTGFADVLSSVKLNRDRELTFLGLNRTRLAAVQRLRSDPTQRDRPFPIFPTRSLVGFPRVLSEQESIERHGERPKFGLEPDPELETWEDYARAHWSIDSRASGLLYRAQSYALAYFLSAGENGLRRPQLILLLRHVLRGTDTPAAFARVLELHSDADWAAFDRRFESFYRGLLAIDLERMLAPPPPLDDWPTYVPTDD